MLAILKHKIHNTDYAQLITKYAQHFSPAEIQLLTKILEQFEFDPAQSQALVQAVQQQSQFDPNALHIETDDEDVTGVCPHCINPPMPPLRDYLMWRQKQPAPTPIPNTLSALF